jgi:hypothetical protein
MNADKTGKGVNIVTWKYARIVSNFGLVPVHGLKPCYTYKGPTRNGKEIKRNLLTQALE